jgi:cytoplasmic iron level regulating protein YaaA (DUF328/UPF0246 family)
MEKEEKILHIIPCSKKKHENVASKPKDYDDPLKNFISKKEYNKVLNIRSIIKNNNHNVIKAGLFMPAIERYNGHLYNCIDKKKFERCILDNTNKPNKDNLLILSGLYGPLHPESLINDYEYKMKNDWSKTFVTFLEDYVKTNNITKIYIYVGKNTSYYNTLINAIKPLLKNKLLSSVVHYNVINPDGGAVRETPKNHGLKLIENLSCEYKIEFTREIEEIKVTI